MVVCSEKGADGLAREDMLWGGFFLFFFWEIVSVDEERFDLGWRGR